MVLRYPNGQPYHKNASLKEKVQEKRESAIEFGNRGCVLKKQLTKVTSIT